MRSRPIRALALAVPLALALAACGSEETPETELAAPSASANTEDYAGAPEPSEELVAAAGEEGTVTVYTGISSESILTAVAGAFNESYPDVDVQWVTLLSSELAGRFDTEAKAGALQGDVVLAGYSQFFADQLDAGQLLPVEELVPGFADLYPEDAIREDGRLPLEFRIVNGIAYDKNKVTGENIPETFEDLAKPYWKDKLIGFELGAVSAYSTFADFLLQEYGEETLQAIWDNVIPNKKFASTVDSAQSLAAGEGEAVLFMSAAAIESVVAAGAPLEFVQPVPSTGGEWAVSAATEGPHPEAAKLFTQWLLTEDGQKAMTDANKSVGPLEGTPVDFWSPPLVVPEEDMTIISSIME